MKHFLLSLALVTGLASYALKNFSDYELYFPQAIFQISYAFNIYYYYAIRVENQNMNQGLFILICMLKRYNKFVFFSLIYFQTFARDVMEFFSIFNYMSIVGIIFISFPLSTWKYFYQKVYLFRFIQIVTDTEFISGDVQFMWTQTIQNPQKLVLFSKPEYEFIFMTHFMGIMTYLQDCVIQFIRKDKFMTAYSGIKLLFQWGLGGLLGYLGFIYFYQLQAQFGQQVILNSEDAFLFTRKIFFLYYLYLGAYNVRASQSIKVNKQPLTNKAKKQQ
ncbi:hypothetical protein ABPG72_004443 [Tetrahymena utriculariae]